MCGRYTLEGEWRSDAELQYFAGIEPFLPRYNVAPTATMPISRLVDGKPQLTGARWGLVPHWAKDLKFGNHCTNARAETVASKPAFRSAFKTRRCLVPASGYYEWQTLADGKQPWYFTHAHGAQLAFAGLWETWRPPAGGDEVLTYTIVVGAANPFTRDIHDRMPIILDKADWDRWLEGPDVSDLLRPAPEGVLKRFPVSRSVNSSRSQGPELIQPIALPA